LVVLRQIQNLLDINLAKASVKWFGTSTGAVISAGLLIQNENNFLVAIQNVLDVYEFRSASSINPLNAIHPDRALKKILDENFSDFSLNQVPKLNIVTTALPEYHPKIFNKDSAASLVSALRASCAVPGVFSPVTIHSKTYVDGFLVAKNPALISLSEETNFENLVVLSLGTGILKISDEIEKEVKMVHEKMESLSKEKGFGYFRFNPRLILASDDMQNTNPKNIFNLKKDTEVYLSEKQEKINDFISLIKHSNC